jgi:hypothetical protein
MGIRELFKKSHAEILPNYGRAYLSHVIAGLLSVSTTEPPLYIAEIVSRSKEQHNVCTWGDLYLLEKYVLSIQPDAQLKRRAWSLRSDFLEMAGTKTYELYLQSRPSNENDANCNAESLRADLDRILDSLHWSYSLIPIRERLRTNIVRDVGLAVLNSTTP